MIPEHVRQVFAVFSVAYPGWEFFKRPADDIARGMQTWSTLVADIEPDALIQAAVAHAQSSRFPPTVAELRERCAPSAPNPGEAAFDLARRAAQHASPYSSERCSEAWAALERKDPIAAQACRDFGGFRAFWDLESEAVNTSRAHFARIYNALAATAKREREAETARFVLNFATLPPMLRERNETRGGEPRRVGP